MTKREKRYLFYKKLSKQANNSLASYLWDDLFYVGMAGTRVYLDENNNVKVDKLSIDDCLDLLELERNGTPIPDDITIKNID